MAKSSREVGIQEEIQRWNELIGQMRRVAKTAERTRLGNSE